MMAMLAVAITWLILVLLFVGIGFFLQRLVGLHNDKGDPFAAFWLGWAYVIVVMQIWQLWLPVDGWAWLPVLLLAGMGVAWRRSAGLRAIKRAFSARWPIWAVFGLYTLWLANQAIGPVIPYDAGLYHLQTVQWLREHPIVPGLGNLHGRLAFNSAYFLFLALLDTIPWVYRAHNLAAGLLVLVAVAEIYWGVCRRFWGCRKATAPHVFAIAFLAPLLQKGTQIASTSPDLAAFVIGFVVLFHLCKIIFAVESRPQDINSLFLIVTLSAAAIAIKLSFAVLGLLAMGIALWKVWSQHPIAKQSVRLVWLPVLLCATWAVRGVIQSGYPVYPLTLGAIDVMWRVPYAQAMAEATWIASWARQPGVDPEVVLADWRWLVPWFARMARSLSILVPLALAATYLLVSFRRRPDRPHLRASGMLALPALGALLFWFFTVPDPRFAGVSFWALAASVVVAAHPDPYVLRHGRWWQPIWLLIAITAGLCLLALQRPGPYGGYYAVPTVAVNLLATEEGLPVYIPVEGDQCWDAPLPCTPELPRHLRSLRTGEIGSGFFVP